MNTLDLLWVIMTSSMENIDDTELKKYMDISCNFIDKDRKFKKLIKSNEENVVEQLSNLSKELSVLQEKLRYFCKINNIKYNGSINIVAYLVLNNKNKFFGNEENLYNINKTLKEEFFIPNFNYLDLFRNVESKIEFIKENEIKTKNKDLDFLSFITGIDKVVFKDMDESNIKKNTDYENLNIVLIIIKMLSLVYKEGGIKAVNKVIMLNDLCINIDEKFKYKNNAKKTDLFNMLYGYDKLKKEKLSDVASVKALCEITDKNGVFKDFTEQEIIEVLYSYIVLYNNSDKIMNDCDEEFVFKDISEIANIISRRAKDGIDSSKTIEDLASGKISIKFNNQSLKQKGNF